MTHESQPPITLKDSTGVKTDARTLIAVITSAVLITAAGAMAWASVKGDIADHSKQLVTIQTTMGADHDQGVKHTAQIENITKTLERMDKKLDYLTGARNERPPASK